ncbi:hypothetical protein HK405_002212, partial [Cladochytrium tenue]
MYQGASSDVVHSAAWFLDSLTFAASLTGRTIKIFDLRASSSSSSTLSTFSPAGGPVAIVGSGGGGVGSNSNLSSAGGPQVATRAVHGIVMDPLETRRFASFGEPPAPGGGGAAVHVWDLRKMPEPLVVLDAPFRHLSAVVWCPTRRGTLAAIGREYGKDAALGGGVGSAAGIGGGGGGGSGLASARDGLRESAAAGIKDSGRDESARVAVWNLLEASTEDPFPGASPSSAPIVGTAAPPTAPPSTATSAPPLQGFD